MIQDPLSNLKHVAVIGGGRWARVIVDVLDALLPARIHVSLYTKGGFDDVRQWVQTKDFQRRIPVFRKWPQALPNQSAIVIANAAKHHEAATIHAINIGVPALIEKPFAVTSRAVERIIQLARTHNVRICAAHVFMFATYIHKFGDLLAASGEVKSVHFEWWDSQSEWRHGEAKQYDPSVPVYMDVMPHVLSILYVIVPSLKPDKLSSVTLAQGGMNVTVEMDATSTVEYKFDLRRNTPTRRRKIEVTTSERSISLDFSMEPGEITIDGKSFCANENWRNEEGPMALMLSNFLSTAFDSVPHPSLNCEIALENGCTIDLITDEYLEQQMLWLQRHVRRVKTLQVPYAYALRELLSKYWEGTELDQRIQVLMNRFLGPHHEQCASQLERSHDVATTLLSMSTP